MSIKVLLALVVFITTIGNCFAQVEWSVKAGLNYANITAKDREGNKANTSSVPGIYLGLGAGIPLSKRFSLQPSLVYAKRGFKQPGSSHIGWGRDFEANVSSFELPIDLLYSPKIGPGELLLAAGPYVGYGTGGSWTTSGPVTVGDIRFEGKGDIAFQNDSSVGGKGMNSYTYARPWDYGAHFRIGYSLFDRYSLSFEIQQGVADLQPNWADYKPESSVRNRSVGVSFGYRF